MKHHLPTYKRVLIIIGQIILMAVLVFHTVFATPAQATDLQQELTPSATPSGTPGLDYRSINWLSTPPTASYLSSDRSFVYLAGELIFHGLVDASACADNGLINSTTASPCGETVARNAAILWQNQFDAAILSAAQQSEVPPYVLKNVIALESQFWPANIPTSYGYQEVGLGHVTEMGADTLLRWDPQFYAEMCGQVFAPETCSTAYVFLPKAQQNILRGAIMQKMNADCGECWGGIDLGRAHASIEYIAAVLHANYNYVDWTLTNRLQRPAEAVFEDDVLWSFALTSYNAGPGCLTTAMYRTQKAGLPIAWENVSTQLDPGCAGAVEYVDQVLRIYPASPESLLAATHDTSKAATLVRAALEPVATTTASATPDTSSTPNADLTPPTASPTASEADLTPVGTPFATELSTETAPPVTTVTAPASATPEPTQPTPSVLDPTDQITEEIVIKFNTLVPAFIANAIISTAGGQIETQVDPLGLTIVSVPPAQASVVLDQLQSNWLVDYAEPNYPLGVFHTPSDPGYVDQGYLADLQVPAAWDMVRGQGVVVAVIDTGVDVTHPDLAANIWINAGENGTDANGNDKRTNGIDDEGNGYVDDWQGWNFVGTTNDVMDFNGHGTHGAGIIAAQMDNGIGVAGIAPAAQIMVLKALDDSGYGTYAQVAEAIIYAVDNGARVINLGFGGTANSEALLAAVDYAYTHDVIVIAAAGNTGTNVVYYPAAYDNVIAVAALDNSQTIASFSTFNNHIDLAAPGLGIYSTVYGNGYGLMSGTSMSSAEVSGIAALLASSSNFDTAVKIHDALIGGAKDLGAAGWDEYYGDGMVQALDSLVYVPVGSPTATNTLPAVTPPTGGTGGVNSMAITALQAWSNQYHGTADTQTITYTIPTGSNTNRLLVVAIASSQTAIGARTVTLTYGNQALTPVNGDMATATVRQHTQLYYLNESGLDAAANTNLSFTITGGTTRVNDVFVAVFDGIDQTTPITDSKTYSSGAGNVTTFAFGTALTVNAGDQAVEIISSVRSANTNARTITYATNWTMVAEQTWATTDGVRNAVANRSIPGTTATDLSSTTLSGNSLASMTAMSLKAAGTPPILTSPTASSILATSATMGADITSDGGSAITARGTCWGTTAAPVTNCVPEGGTATGIFTQARTGLPAGTLIYYRGYATNATSTGYSPDGSFYTEPATQASGVNFTAVGSNSFTANWTRGSGSGVIVLIKATSAVNSDPVDGTYTGYSANTVFGSGTQLGTGNFVVYKGTGTSVAVTGLSPSTTYYVAVYEFAGTVDTVGDNQGTNYKLTPATGNQITITGGNTPPTVSITAPSNGASFIQGTNITFTGIATDAQDGNLTTNLSWTSSIDGAIGTGGSFTKSNLSVGTHTITAAVTDSGGLGGSASITITITMVNVAPVASNDYYNTPKDTLLTVAAPGVLKNDSDANGNPLTAVSFTALNPPAAGALVTNANGSFTFTPAAGWTGTASFTYQASDGSLTSNIATVYISVSTPHGPYGSMTDECARCHRVHTADSNRLIESPTSPLTSNAFCFSCHTTGAVTVSTHSNADKAGVEASFELLCIQCHEPHGSANLFNTRDLVRVKQSPAIITTGPVVFTALTGANSYDEIDSALPESAANNVDDICVTCHVNTNNVGYPMASHSGGGNHSGGIDYRGQDCTTCHKHSADNVASTRDGFMASGCRGCHSSTQGTRRQIVGATGGDFTRASHHVVGADTVTDSDCIVCHDQSTHMAGTVRLKNADTGASLLASDNAQYETFCAACHDSNGANGDTTPFSDNTAAIVINNGTWWTNASHNIAKGSFTASCKDCHDNGHGSNKISLLAPWNYTNDGNTQDGMMQEERFCFNCHSPAATAGFPKAGFASKNLYSGFNTAILWVNSHQSGNLNLNDRHDVQLSAQTRSGAKIECTDCHDVHRDNNSTPPMSLVRVDPDPNDGRVPGTNWFAADTTNNPGGQGTNAMSEWCLDCHDGSYPTGVLPHTATFVNILTGGPVGTSWGNSQHGGVTTTGAALKTTYTAPWAMGEVIPCRTCHEAHPNNTPQMVTATLYNNLFQLSDLLSARDGVTLVPKECAGKPTCTLQNYEVTLMGGNQNVNYYYWCNTCHIGSMGNTQDCTGCHRHGDGRY